MADKPIGKDATGYEILTDAMKALLNQYPGLYENETIKFEELGKESGIAFSADNGALVYKEKMSAAQCIRYASIHFMWYTEQHPTRKGRNYLFRSSLTISVNGYAGNQLL